MHRNIVPVKGVAETCQIVGQLLEVDDHISIAPEGSFHGPILAEQSAGDGGSEAGSDEQAHIRQQPKFQAVLIEALRGDSIIIPKEAYGQAPFRF